MRLMRPPAGPPQGRAAPPRGAANEVSVGAVSCLEQRPLGGTALDQTGEDLAAGEFPAWELRGGGGVVAGVEAGEERAGPARGEGDDAIPPAARSGPDVEDDGHHGVELALGQGHGDGAAHLVFEEGEVLGEQLAGLGLGEGGGAQRRPFGLADDMAVADGPFAGRAEVAPRGEFLEGLDETDAGGRGVQHQGAVLSLSWGCGVGRVVQSMGGTRQCRRMSRRTTSTTPQAVNSISSAGCPRRTRAAMAMAPSTRLARLPVRMRGWSWMAMARMMTITWQKVGRIASMVSTLMRFPPGACGAPRR